MRAVTGQGPEARGRARREQQGRPAGLAPGDPRSEDGMETTYLLSLRVIEGLDFHLESGRSKTKYSPDWGSGGPSGWQGKGAGVSGPGAPGPPLDPALADTRSGGVREGRRADHGEPGPGPLSRGTVASGCESSRVQLFFAAFPMLFLWLVPIFLLLLAQLLARRRAFSVLGGTPQVACRPPTLQPSRRLWLLQEAGLGWRPHPSLMDPLEKAS